MLKDLLGSRLRARLIGWLFSHADEVFFGRQIAVQIGEDPKNVSRELARLSDLGILTCETVGRQKHYRANPACPIFEELKGLAVKTAGVADVVREALTPLSQTIAVAFLYGSQASGDFTAKSDVDLMVVGDVEFGEVVAAIGPAESKLAREINPTVYSPDEFHRKVAGRHHFLTTVLQSPKVFLIGSENDLTGMDNQGGTEKASDEPTGD